MQTARNPHAGFLSSALANQTRRVIRLLWRRLPPHLRTRWRRLDPINRMLLRAGAEPLATARLRRGHRLLLDLRSGTEWFTYYTGAFDEGRIEAACRLLQRPGAVAVDAGANIGLWTVALAHAARTSHGHVIAVEPVPQNAARLAQNLRLNGLERTVTIREVAVSDRRSTMTMTLREDFLAGAGTGNAAAVIADGHDGRFATVEADAVALDDLLDACGRPDVDVIKVDIEGHEDKFLAGASRTFRCGRPVAFIEWNSRYYQRRHVDPTAATQHHLEAWNYRCLRWEAGHWMDTPEFSSPKPIDDLVLVPAERLNEVRRLLEDCDPARSL